MRAWGNTLLIGSFLTLVWFFVCPTYQGTDTVQVRRQQGHATVTTTEPREHVVQGIFVPIGFVLWTALCGVCLLRRDLAAYVGSRDLLMPPRSPATLQPAAKAQDAARPD